MRFISTRGQGPAVTAPEAVLQGIAPDGGLYLPDALPALDWQRLPDDYPALAEAVFHLLLPGYAPDQLAAAAQGAYGSLFTSPEVAPVVPVGDAFILELFHGPTAAFKDLALCALPQLMVSARDSLMPGSPLMILTATSGDTGSAAMAGFRDLPGTRTAVFYPQAGVSPVQRAQMRRMPGDNLFAYGIRGDFDAAQAGVKAAFAQAGQANLPANLLISSANSINIGRLVPQVVYYISACKALAGRGQLKPGEALHVIVPSGNFGDILAALLAKRMGLPLGKLVCASNQNQVLTDFLTTGHYDRRRKLHLSISPSMDILVSSNVERLLHLATGGDSGYVAGLMQMLNNEGHYQLSDSALGRIQEDFLAVSAAEEDTRAAIRQAWEAHHYVLDPHAAVAWHAWSTLKSHLPPGKALVLATASPFKFPQAVLKALGVEAADSLDAMALLSDKTGLPLPPALAWLADAPDIRHQVIDPADIPATAFKEARLW